MKEGNVMMASRFWAILVLAFLALSMAVTAASFNSTWDTTLTSTGSSNSTQVKLPLESAGTYSFTVNWGDGNTNYINTWNQTEVNHTYASSGKYALTINGTIVGWRFNNAGDKLKITNITQDQNRSVWVQAASLTSINRGVSLAIE